MEGVCSGEEVQLREAQLRPRHSGKITFWNGGEVCDRKGEENRVWGCAGRNLGDAKYFQRVLKWVAVNLSSPLFFSWHTFLLPCSCPEPDPPPHEQQGPPSPGCHCSVCWAAAGWEKTTPARIGETLSGTWMGSEKVALQGRPSFVLSREHVG